tara:strand:- start:1579 stop:2502 length:924 start_codon:yes stop_codon:yes gene_type:complete
MIYYIKMLRIDHWIKNLFILPGFLLGYLIFDLDFELKYIINLLIVFIASSLVASSNYLINEWLDRENDAKHPDKKHRPAVSGKIKFKFVLTLYFLLISLGLYLSYIVNVYSFWACLAFVISGIIYNVKPIRAKDIRIFDVLVESFNNPIRMYIGWFALSIEALIPLSLFFAYWFFGAFLMNCKRITDYKKFDNNESRILFRPSLGNYSLNYLFVLALIYSMISTSFFMTFAVRYKIEMIMLLPLIVIAYSLYFLNSLGKESVAAEPEKLMRSRKFLYLSISIIILFYFLLKIDIPILDKIIFYSFNL